MADAFVSLWSLFLCAWKCVRIWLYTVDS